MSEDAYNGPSPFGSRQDLRPAQRAEKLVTLEGTSFSPRLVYDLALELEPAEATFERHGIEVERAVKLIQSKAFIAMLNQAKAEVEAGGITFRMKAKVLAEDALREAYLIATDPEVGASTRLDALKSLVNWGDLNPPPKEKTQGGGDPGAGRPGFSLQIVLQGGEGQGGRVIDVQGAPVPAPAIEEVKSE